MKRIITCSDGTWNKLNPETNTNVVKMYNTICATGKDACGNEVPQLKLYDEGVGTGYTFSDRLLGGATGSGIDANIKDLYTFIILNYEPGDQLYLFGFSRGAYTARSVGGLIRNSGVLKRENLYLVDKAYDLYRDKNDYSSPDSDLMRSFRQEYAMEETTLIHFIGVWDTVGALGVPLPWYQLLNAKKYKFHDVTLSAFVRHAYHALALDERRQLFSPTLWTQEKSAILSEDPPQQFEQRWFSGVHSNIGGGYTDSGLSNISLQWLFDKATGAGLCFNPPPLISPTLHDKGRLINSYTMAYWFWLPKHRQLFKKKHTNEVIDYSVWQLFRTNKRYRPQALVMLYNVKHPEEKPMNVYTLSNIIRGLPAILLFYLFTYFVFIVILGVKLYPVIFTTILGTLLYIAIAIFFNNYVRQRRALKK